MWAVAPLLAQSVTVNVAGDTLRVRAPGFTFIKGEPLARLKDGRAVQIDFALAVLPKPAGAAIAETRQGFVLSYDLWEERFAVTIVDPEPRPRIAGHFRTSRRKMRKPGASITRRWHERSAVSAGTRCSGSEWPIRCATATCARSRGRFGFSLRGLIDRLSRRTNADDLRDAIDAGPFRLPR